MKKTFTLLLALLGTFGSSWAYKDVNRPDDDNNDDPWGGGGGITSNCALPQSRAILDINNVRAMVLSGGDMWWDLNNAFYEVPRQDDPNQPKKHSIFAGSVWIGGNDAANGDLLVTGQTYRQGQQSTYWTGPIYDGVITDQGSCEAWDRHFKINRREIDEFLDLLEESEGNITEADVSPAVLLWPGRNNPHLLTEPGSQFQPNFLNMNLAPFVDANGDGIYDPLDGDFPSIRGDQSIWWIVNDIGNTKNFGGNRPPQVPGIGIEMKTLAFAFSTNNALNNATFYEQTIQNKGPRTVNDCYMGQWVDPDLGNFDDDYVGCDVGRGLGICYNGDDFDEGIAGYGLNPPSVGVDFFEGPLADIGDGIDNNRNCIIDEDSDGLDNTGNGLIDDETEREQIIMSNFVYYNNDFDPINGNPENAIHYYNYLRGIWKNGDFLTYDGLNGTDQSRPRANFMFPGRSDLDIGWGLGGNCAAPITDRSLNFEWSEETAGNVPGDRRFLQSAGSFTLVPGAINRITVGIVWARANSGGATGSFNRLLAADDLAQRLFDNNFELLRGPNAPDLAITELDQEVILNIVPDTFSVVQGGPLFHTENYEEFDRSFPDEPYRFQGYKIFQLRDNTVSVDELSNPDPDLARLVLQSDVRDDIGRIINLEFDPDLDEDIPVIKVEGANNGIQRTIRLTQDLFATGADNRLINYNRYYYAAVAYAYNGAENNPDRYLEGRFNGRVYTVIPRQSSHRFNGTVLNASFGNTLEVTRQAGTGTGRRPLQLVAGEEPRVIGNTDLNNVLDLRYEAGNTPVAIKVYDPLRVRNGDFTLRMLSRLEFDRTNMPQGFQFQPGDRLESLLNTNTGGSLARVSVGRTNITQVPGVAIVNSLETRRVLDNDLARGTLRVEMLNDRQGGTFTLGIDSLGEPEGGRQQVLEYKFRPQPFRVIRNDQVVAELTCLEFQANDLWELTTPDNGIVYSPRPISADVDQTLPEYGLSFDFRHGFSPGYQASNSGTVDNYFLQANLTFDNPTTAWLRGVTRGDNPFNQMRWLRAASAEYAELDPAGVYLNVLGGAIAPYAAVANVLPGTPNDQGAAYPESRITREVGLSKAGNVDIVFTNDQALWTRVAVMQRDRGAGVQGRFRSLTRSDSLSLDRNGNLANTTSPFGDGRPSRGMSWFPGYAIDIDRGVRLNMVIAESSGLDTINGNNLRWEPNASRNGGFNPIYVLDTPYDEGRSTERYLDSVSTLALTRIGPAMQIFYNDVKWVFMPRLTDGARVTPADGYAALANRARVQVRVQQYYTSFGGTPTYAFSTTGLGAVTGRRETASEALKQVRIVPNPYYAFSTYENSNLDTRVKLTNLPQRCTINIFTVNGTLIRTFRKDDTQSFFDWNLRNANNVPIASGAYIIHLDAGELGERIVKFFCVMRPNDLDSF